MNSTAHNRSGDKDTGGGLSKNRGSRKLLLAVVCLVGLLALATVLPVKTYFEQTLEWVRGLGVWGPVVLAVIYVPACVFMLPGSMLTLGAGLLFGVVKGTIAVSIGSTVGATAAFLVGRTVARDWIAAKIAQDKKFATISDAVAKEGFKIVFLTRLSPIFPFSLLNYAYGLTTVPLHKYVLASWIGMMPGTVMYVYLGSSLSSLADVAAGNVEKTAGQQVLFYVGLLVTVIVSVLVTRIARRALKQAVPTEIEKGDK